MRNRHEFTAYAFAGELDLNRLKKRMTLRLNIDPVLLYPCTIKDN